jgi:broad specificity phosphatase PhoE
MRQAREMGNLLMTADFFLKQHVGCVFTSPLRRAIQTACAMFGCSSCTIPGGRIIVLPMISEIRTSIGDTGHTFEELLADPVIRPLLHLLDFEKYAPQSNERWWPSAEPCRMGESAHSRNERLEIFERWLKAQLHNSNVVLVGHSQFWMQFERRVTSNQNVEILKNCRMAQLEFLPMENTFARQHAVFHEQNDEIDDDGDEAPMLSPDVSEELGKRPKSPLR